MREQPLRPRPCSVATALEILGERWSLLAIREMGYGAHTFAKVAAYTGASRDILADRLGAGAQRSVRQLHHHVPDHVGGGDVAEVAGLSVLERFQLTAGTYNTTRPHRSLPHRATPATAYAARPKATPADRSADAHYRVRTDVISTSGAVAVRTGGKLYHIGIGRIHAGTAVLLLIADLHIRIINAATGQQLRELTLDPTRDYQPTGRPPGPAKQTPRTQ